MTPSARLRVGLAAFALIAALAVVPVSAAEAAGPSAPTSLRCEYLDNPMGIDMAKPRFFWVLGHAERGQVQSAYQIVVSTDPKAAAGDVWDSGKVASAKSTQVAFAGKALESGKSYFWKVRTWDRDGRESPWSAVARFDTGLFDKSDWKGVWIGKQEPAPQGVQLSRAGSSGPGPTSPASATTSSASTAARPATTSSTRPGRPTTSASSTSTYDVTSSLRDGANAVAVMLGNGWYKSRALLLQLNVELEDGTTASVVSDASWKAADGPIFEDSIYNGETYDARLETPGWDRPGFDDKDWPAAETVKGPAGRPFGPDDAGHPGRRHDRPAQDDEPPARRLRLRHGPELQRLGPPPGRADRAARTSGCASPSCSTTTA